MGLPSRDRAGGSKESRGLKESGSTGSGWKVLLSRGPASGRMGLSAHQREVLPESGPTGSPGHRRAVRWECGRRWEAMEHSGDFRGVRRDRGRGVARLPGPEGHWEDGVFPPADPAPWSGRCPGPARVTGCSTGEQSAARGWRCWGPPEEPIVHGRKIAVAHRARGRTGGQSKEEPTAGMGAPAERIAVAGPGGTRPRADRRRGARGLLGSPYLSCRRTRHSAAARQRFRRRVRMTSIEKGS